MSANIEDQIRCVAREIAMRKNYYPKLIARGKINAAHARYEIATMQGVLETLRQVAREKPLKDFQPLKASTVAHLQPRQQPPSVQTKILDNEADKHLRSIQEE